MSQSSLQRISHLFRLPVPGAGEQVPVVLSGWVRTRRDSKGGFSFIDLTDGSCLSGIQVVADQALQNYTTEILHLGIGCSVRVEGLLIPSAGRGQTVEVKATAITAIGHCDPLEYPLQKQATSIEHLRSIPHLRGRTRTFTAIMRLRHHLAQAVHRFFDSRGFVWIHTPIITASDCEGAGKMFRVSTLDPEKLPRTTTGKIDWSQDFFGQETSLTVSGQLEGETYATALGRIYTFGPTFRAENSNTPRHLAEFWMIEPEMAFCDLDGDRQIAEEFVREVLASALSSCDPEIAFLEKQSPNLRQRLTHIAQTPFRHLRYDEAIVALEKSGKKFEFPVSWGIDLQTEHERWLTEDYAKGPVVVTNYPKAIKAFYMRQDPDGRTVSAMDVLVPQMGELIGGSQREERLDVLIARMKESGLDPARYSHYLDLRRFGTVPHAGFGLGFERLVCLAGGLANIRDSIPYPRTPGNCP